MPCKTVNRMAKVVLMISCLCSIVGCHPGVKYTTSREYVKEWEYSKEDGIVKRPQSASAHFEMNWE